MAPWHLETGRKKNLVESNYITPENKKHQGCRKTIFIWWAYSLFFHWASSSLTTACHWLSQWPHSTRKVTSHIYWLPVFAGWVNMNLLWTCFCLINTLLRSCVHTENPCFCTLNYNNIWTTVKLPPLIQNMKRVILGLLLSETLQAEPRSFRPHLEDVTQAGSAVFLQNYEKSGALLLHCTAAVQWSSTEVKAFVASRGEK